MTPANQELSESYLAEFCQRHGIVRLSVFGSRQKGNASSHSDLDLLVEFDPSRKVSLFDVGGMMAELTEHLGVQVDLRTSNDLSPLFRDRVLKDARTVYVRDDR